jgi:hypothetical protein
MKIRVVVLLLFFAAAISVPIALKLDGAALKDCTALECAPLYKLWLQHSGELLVISVLSVAACILALLTTVRAARRGATEALPLALLCVGILIGTLAIPGKLVFNAGISSILLCSREPDSIGCVETTHSIQAPWSAGAVNAGLIACSAATAFALTFLNRKALPKWN